MSAVRGFANLLFVGCCLLFIGCDTSRVFESYQEVEEGAWSMNQAIEFDVELEQGVSYNYLFNLRNAGSYAYSNLYVFWKMEGPDGWMKEDTTEFLLADPSGKWYGKGLGDIIENQIIFRLKTNVPKTGSYRFTFVQGMREEQLRGVLDVGFRVERSE